MCYRERRKEKNKVKEIELLAPAGSFEKAKIAFLYGADAVYCGTASLSLRSRAEIQDDDLIQTIKYAHSIGKKVYVALNIYAWDETYPEIIEMAKKIRRNKTRWNNCGRWRSNRNVKTICTKCSNKCKYTS